MNNAMNINQQNKRRHGQKDEVPVVVDDMTVAMQAATAHLVSLVAYESSDDDDDDDDVRSKGTVNSTNSSADERENLGRDLHVGQNSLESDDESDVDLTEALAKMETDYGSDVEISKHSRNKKKDKTSASGPKTANEIDAYGSKLPGQLLSAFAATKSESELVRASQMGGNLCAVAGHVKYHLAAERTLVVESSLSAAQDGPLDEGSLLMFRDFCGQEIVLIGKIFEVFGPVTRPLYTIRLLNSSESEASGEAHINSSSIKVEADVQSDNSKEMVKKENGAEEEKEMGNGTCSSTEPASAPQMSDAATTDPWSEDGSLTKSLKSTTSLPVYYIKGTAQNIDTGMILKQSGKGCDASNIHDEELPLNQVEFSDDEEERRVKNAAKKKKKGKKNRVVSDGGLSAAAAAAGYPTSSTIPPYHPPRSYTNPQHQYHPPYQQQAQYAGQPQQHHYGYVGASQSNHHYPPYFAPPGYPPPPPPPQQYAYNNDSTMYNYSAPPPPPYYTGGATPQSDPSNNQQGSSSNYNRMTHNPYQNE